MKGLNDFAKPTALCWPVLLKFQAYLKFLYKKQLFFAFLVGMRKSVSPSLCCIAVSRPPFYEILLARVQGRSRTSHFVLLALGRTDGPEVSKRSKYSSDMAIFCRDFGLL